MIDTPLKQIRNSLINEIPPELINKLPDKWEKIGDVLTLVLPTIFDKYKNIIGKQYAKILNCKTVLKDRHAVANYTTSGELHHLTAGSGRPLLTGAPSVSNTLCGRGRPGPAKGRSSARDPHSARWMSSASRFLKTAGCTNPSRLLRWPMASASNA